MSSLAKISDTALDFSGKPVEGASVRVTVYSSGALATLYDDDETTTLSNPLTTDARGYWEANVAVGEYNIVVSKDGDTLTRTKIPAVTGDSPTFTDLTLTGDLTMASDSTATLDHIAAADGSAVVIDDDTSIDGNLAVTGSTETVGSSGSDFDFKHAAQDSRLAIVCGTTVGSDPTILGYGSTHPTFARLMYYRANGHRFQSVAGAEYVLLNSAALSLNGIDLTLDTGTTATLDHIAAADGSAVVSDDDIVLDSAKFIYWGDPSTDGSWRQGRSGNDLVTERRESGSWVTKQTISA